MNSFKHNNQHSSVTKSTHSSYPQTLRVFRQFCTEVASQGWHEANGGNLSMRISEKEVLPLIAEYQLCYDEKTAETLIQHCSCGHSYHKEYAEKSGNIIEQKLQNLPALPYLKEQIHKTHPALSLGEHNFPSLAGQFFLVTASGGYLRRVEAQAHELTGLVMLSAEGNSYYVVCGFGMHYHSMGMLLSENESLSSGHFSQAEDFQLAFHPTSELFAHLGVYEAAPTSTVVYHGHPNALVSLSHLFPANSLALTQALWSTIPECPIMCPEGIGVADFASPGSDQLAHETFSLARRYKAIMWALHGMLVHSNSLDSVFGMMETLEKAADIYLKVHSSSLKEQGFIGRSELMEINSLWNCGFDLEEVFGTTENPASENNPDISDVEEVTEKRDCCLPVSPESLPLTLELVERGKTLRIIDQTQLPQRLAFLELHTWEETAEAISCLQVRGAPAIGLAGAAGLVLYARNQYHQEAQSNTPEEFEYLLGQTAQRLAKVRPTAVNLSWAVNQVYLRALEALCSGKTIDQTINIMEAYAQYLRNEDERACRTLGAYGAQLIPENARILTHCNAGSLATSFYGTALGVIYSAFSQGKIKQVFIDETRPVGQGVRLTSWELAQAGVPATLICDNMAASLMEKGLIDAVVVGADRICANGDTANKIGTYGLAVLAHYHHIPFYVAAPSSTIDTQLASGAEIPIEERSSNEVSTYVPEGIDVYNPAFDVSPSHLISAIITEKGVFRAPYRFRF